MIFVALINYQVITVCNIICGGYLLIVSICRLWCRLFLHYYIEVATVPTFNIAFRIEGNGVLTILCKLKVVAI